MSDNSKNQSTHDEQSDSDEEEEEEGIDPEVKEKERKVSEKRLIKIIHSNEFGDSRENTPKLPHKLEKGEKLRNRLHNIKYLKL